ncbi:MAG: DUF169 domain-containing protein [Muribaculaceae bacterium]|nr:DUF169 domain-containing protein [Muribaculaceae bacterium]
MEYVPGCIFKQFHKAANGTTVTLSVANLTCGGGKPYLGLEPLPERVYGFVSNVEKYKQNPNLVKQAIEQIDIRPSEKPYVNFVRIDSLKSFDGIEGVIFFASPDVISGLFSWANYDIEDINAVMSPWGSGCSTSVTSMVNENRQGGKHCFLGFFDISARPYFKSDILSFSIPRSRFVEMCETLSYCCVSGVPAWLKVRKRINFRE